MIQACMFELSVIEPEIIVRSFMEYGQIMYARFSTISFTNDCIVKYTMNCKSHHPYPEVYMFITLGSAILVCTLYDHTLFEWSNFMSEQVIVGHTWSENI